MYRAYFGIEEKPFAISPDERYLYLTSKHQEALGHLVYGVEESGGFVLLTGEVGTGKTLVSRRFLANLRDNVEVALCLNPRLTDLELLETLCDELGIEHPRPAVSRKDLMDRITDHLLRAYAAGKRVLLIIDEAQDLDPEVLEQVRLLTNLETGTNKLLQIILVGQPELLELLSRPELRQVNQRITARYHLMPLTRAEMEGYIRHRLSVAGMDRRLFNPSALGVLYAASGGVPRLVNAMADRCLLAAYAKRKRQVDRRMARDAAREVLGGRTTPGARRRFPLLPLLASGAAATVAVLVAVGAMELGGGDAGRWSGAARVLEPIRSGLVSLIGGEHRVNPGSASGAEEVRGLGRDVTASQ